MKYYEEYQPIFRRFEEKAKLTIDDLRPLCLTYNRYIKDVVKEYEEAITSCWENGDKVMKSLFQLLDKAGELVCSGDTILKLSDKLQSE